MRVVYEKTMVERVRGAIVEAKYLGKNIEKIVLTEPEVRKLLLELDTPYLSPSVDVFKRWLDRGPSPVWRDMQPDLTVFGARIELEQGQGVFA